MQTETEKNRNKAAIQVYPVYAMSLAKYSCPAFSDNLTITGAKIIAVMNIAKKIPVFMPKR
ncbi:MAG: hypothetical protein NT178_08785 [Proteobacteria bacterium]|nr:hypothetical protein [Pseudomonadota bacterium]